MDREKGYSPDEFIKHPDLALEFLEIIELKSYNILEADWKEYANDEAIEYAIYILNEVMVDQTESAIARSRGQIN